MVTQSSSESYATRIDSPRVDVGMLAPDFALPDPDGRVISLRDLRGHSAILAFCPCNWDLTCADQLLHFNELVRRVPGVNAELAGISTNGMWCELALTDGDVRVPLLADIDPYGAVAERFGVTGMHAIFVIGPDSVVRWCHIGATGRPPKMERVVSALNTIAAMDGAFASKTPTIAEIPDSPPPGPRSYMDEVLGLWPPYAEASGASMAQDTVGGYHPLNSSRGNFVATALAASLACTAMPRVNRAQSISGKFNALAGSDVSAIPATLKVNGHTVALNLEPRLTLVDALRDYADLGPAAPHQRGEGTVVERLPEGETLRSMQEC